ncbi:beta-propeller domain-containing protein [Pseudoalteromonas sp. McH1-7]|uniref:beta-propeller domain-containing protein n=1 Tax=unclassified Pseudoalteromonas TaxID=194690 RepID=UPI001591C1B0|nr:MULTISPECIES: beta-propeller domain-containing protein [unclassified Pseudoalteromonas]NUZ12831.1 beta-propeller domain-containing protein [Pseudoalteromonas sp. McH1-7]USD30443.1 beta-propeller domain-containing protein [Pseudoalteromonas sp. SCSIO 43201]
MNYKIWLSLPLAAGLSACGGSSNNEENKMLPALNALNNSTAPLQASSTAQFSQFVKNGIFIASGGGKNGEDVSENPAATTVTTPYSGTNQLVDGVSQSDRIKFDGRYLYITGTTEVAYEGDSSKTFVRVLDTVADEVPVQVNELIVSDSAFASQNLYLQDHQLISVLMDYDYDFADDISIQSIQPQVDYQGFIELAFSDVSMPEQAAVEKRFRMDGSLVGSRLIGDTLYVIAEHTLSYSGYTDNDRLASYNQLMDMDVNALLPTFKNLQTNAEAPLVAADSCYLPADATALDGYHGLTTITQVNIHTPDDFKTTCVSTRTAGFYMSATALYLYNYTFADNTDEVNTAIWQPHGLVLHQLTLNNEGVTYQATGEVEGQLAQVSSNMAATRFDEQDGMLRVFTSKYDTSMGNSHKLHILKPEGNTLVTVATLPNDKYPTPIGKVNPQTNQVDEDVYAVRYFGDTAYVVTFRQTDPLYVLDLSDVTEPKMVGSLEVPGFSSYLHPIGEGLLLGVGQHVTEPNSEVASGTQVSLFDVADPAAPKLLKAHIFEGGFTPLEYDYRTLAMLKDNESVTRFTLPIVYWTTEQESDASSTWYTANDLAAFEVVQGVDSTLTYRGSSRAALTLPISNDKVLGYTEADRGLIQGDKLLYIHGNYVWQSDWLTPQNNTGPH